MSRASFPLFQTPLDLAHHYWERLLRADDCVIDATCGNGQDTVVLGRLVPHGRVIALASQEYAIQVTKQKVDDLFAGQTQPTMTYLVQSHQSFPCNLAPESVGLIVYNLGYLPGSDKQLTTMKESTLQSLAAALPLIRPGGAISLITYPGHPGGKEEQDAAIAWASGLDQQSWSCCRHQWLNRLYGPSLTLIQRSLPL